MSCEHEEWSLVLLEHSCVAGYCKKCDYSEILTLDNKQYERLYKLIKEFWNESKGEKK